jgi:hypothetical protein
MMPGNQTIQIVFDRKKNYSPQEKIAAIDVAFPAYYLCAIHVRKR